MAGDRPVPRQRQGDGLVAMGFVSALLVVLLVAGFIYSVEREDLSGAYSVLAAAVVAVLGLMWTVYAGGRPAQHRAYDRGYDRGYDAGYMRGHRAGSRAHRRGSGKAKVEGCPGKGYVAGRIE